MKRILALFLILVFTISLASGVQAAEVSASRFLDWDQVEQKADVAMLVDLGLFSGYDDGYFRPYNSITRAEISKVVASLLTVAVPAANGISFRDTAGSWACDYIAYCVGQNILSGSPDGLFRPDDNVTARELAKMLLAALGRDTSRYVGAGWADAVDADAEEAGIYDGYSKPRTLYVSREDACLLINNALQCSVITGYAADGTPQYALDSMMTPKSLLEYRYNIMLVTGMVEANAVADLRTSGSRLESGRIRISGYTRDFLVSEDVARDVGLLGHTVTLYARFGSSFNQVFGMPSIRTAEQSVTLSSASELELLVSYNALKLTNDTRYFKNLNPDDYSCLSTMVDGDTVTAIDHEGDGVVDVVMVTTAAARAALW